MTPIQFILAAAVVAALCFFAYVCGYKSGREDEREEVKITKRQRARKLLVVHTRSAIGPRNGSVLTQGGLPSQNDVEWFKAVT